jgi:hypothetical protein
MNLNMRASLLALVLISLLMVSGCLQTDQPIGGETDEHGCLLMGGYTWCEPKQKCLRTWEEECPGYCMGMSIEEAETIAMASECGEIGTLKETSACNTNTGTWWIDLDLDKPGCAPACVVDIESKTAEINWRCTGLDPGMAPPAGPGEMS